MEKADFPGDTIGYINFAAFLRRTPVMDTHQLKAAVPRVHYADHGTKRQVGVRRSKGFGIEALAVGGFAPVEPWAIPAGVAYPGLNRLDGLIQVRYQGGLHHRSDEEHKRYPAERSPHHEESMSHSVFFVLLGSRKV